jgi:hypothetical protein
MFSREKEPTPLESEIGRLLDLLSVKQSDSEEYGKVLDRLSKLHKMKVEETPESVSRDTLVIAATNLLGILLIIRYENVNVISSKAMGMVQRLR